MNKAFLCRALRLPSGHPFHSLRTPVASDIRKSTGFSGKEISKYHGKTVQIIILCRKDIGRSPAFPVEGRVQNCFGKVCIRLIIRPHTLSLEAGKQCISSKRLFYEALIRKPLIAFHNILHNERHLYDKLPFFILLLSAVCTAVRIRIVSFPAVCLYPCKCLFELLFIINAQIHSPQDLCHIDPFRTHAQILYIKQRINKGSHDSHGNCADSHISPVLHLSDYGCTSCKPQNLFLYIGRDFALFHILYISSVNGIAGQLHLVVCRKRRSQINGSRTLRTVKAPDCLNGKRRNINRF